MNIVMSYIDYSMAGIAERELFSCTKAQTESIYQKLKATDGVLGSVLIATCNRTELYLSLEDQARLNPFDLLCVCLGLDYSRYEHMNKTLTGDDAMEHLCKVASGAMSQIWGDDQIVTQVDDAVKAAQKAKASDAILNTMFRIGVSAGKKVKTLVDFKVDDNSTAARAASVIKGCPSVHRVLVIGNGMIGRAVAEILVRAGYDTTMTQRQYRHGTNVFPKGVNIVPYEDRYQAIAEHDAVISATLSPHCTVYYDGVRNLPRIPQVFVDLAVPRDIDPKVAELDQVLYYDVDDISRDTRDAMQEEQMKEIEEIISKYQEDFHKWHEYREKLRRESA